MQAKEATLAFLRAPAVGDDYGQEAGQAFAALAWGKPLKARVLARVRLRDCWCLFVSIRDGRLCGSATGVLCCSDMSSIKSMHAGGHGVGDLPLRGGRRQEDGQPGDGGAGKYMYTKKYMHIYINTYINPRPRHPLTNQPNQP